MYPNPQVLEVWGDFACFSRPELKVERLSYPCITPCAARGIFDAIYAKPAEFLWQVMAIELLAPPTYITLRRNEVKDKINVNAVFDWMAGRRDVEPLWADGDRELLGTDARGADAAPDHGSQERPLPAPCQDPALAGAPGPAGLARSAVPPPGFAGEDLSRPGTSTDAPAVSLFHAMIRSGVLQIPEYGSADVRKAAGGRS